MFCSKCGQQTSDESAFCGKCGAAMPPRVPPPQSSQQTATQAPGTGNLYSNIGIICGIVAFLIVPIVFGPAGLILGAVGKSKGESRAVIAMVIGGVGMVVGMILGAMMWSSV